MSNIDDDRLLAFALGLDDDPELRAALAAQPLLQRRLDVIKAEVAQVQDDLQELVPPAAAAYEQPAAERWRKLRPYLSTPAAGTAAAAASDRGRPAWRRVLVPAAALLAVLAVAVGVTVRLQSQGAGTSGVTAGSNGQNTSAGANTAAHWAPRSSDKSVYGTSGGGSAGALSALNNQYSDELSGPGATKNALPSASNYATVVVARAGFVVGGAQSYTVVRSLKGKVDATVAVTLHAGILLYAPAARFARAQTGVGGLYSLPVSPLAELLTPAGALRVLYLQPRAGKPVRVLLLPAGTTSSSVRLP